MKTIHICEKCDQKFDSFDECQDHELNCSTKVVFTCDKCGNKKEWNVHDKFACANEQECHYIDLGRMGYGSSLDGCDVNFQLCDDCLANLIDTFTPQGQAKIHNSGSNEYGSDEDWIKRNITYNN